MKDFKKIFEERLKADSAAVSASNAENLDCITEKKSADVPKVENEKEVKESVEQSPSIQFAGVSYDVPIYTAKPEEIEYWHCGVTVLVDPFLRRHDFCMGTSAFDAFKIGVDSERHAITFAVDDTHFMKIDLDEYNATILDREQAEKVLRKANEMRFEKLKNWGQYSNAKTVRILLDFDEG